MCLALGEDPKLLLRGSKIEEFIKYGENQARVQVRCILSGLSLAFAQR